MRIALYVYSQSTITIEPSAPIDFMRMQSDYSAKFEVTISSPIKTTLEPGVYGFIYNGNDGVTSQGSVTIVTDTYDVMKKTPWPHPPPPPPPPYATPLRKDWESHAAIFLTPLGGTFLPDAD